MSRNDNDTPTTSVSNNDKQYALVFLEKIKRKLESLFDCCFINEDGTLGTIQTASYVDLTIAGKDTIRICLRPVKSICVGTDADGNDINIKPGLTGIANIKKYVSMAPKQVSSAAFQDPAMPTTAELDAWVKNNCPDAPNNAYFYYGGELGNPKWGWLWNCDAMTAITVKSPTSVNTCIAVEKTCEPGIFTEGSIVPFTITVTACGNEALQNVTLTLPPEVAATASSLQIASIPAGQSVDVTASAVVNATQASEGKLICPVTAQGVGEISGSLVSDMNTKEVDISPLPTIALTKTAASGTYKEGASVEIVYGITNTGSETLTNVMLTAPGVTLTGANWAELLPGQTVTNVAIKTITAAEAAAGSIDCETTVSSTGETTGIAANDTQSVTIDTIVYVTCIEMVKTSAAGPFQAGQSVAITFVLSNCGNDELTNVTLSAPGVTLAANSFASIPVGGSVQTTGTYTVTAADAKAGPVECASTATGVGAICGETADTSETLTIAVLALTADAVDSNRGDSNIGAVAHNLSDNDSPCSYGNTTYALVAGSEINVSGVSVNATTGAYTANIDAFGAWSFEYNILCDGVICDTATESGVGVKINDADAVDNARGNEGFGVTISHNVSDNDTPCNPGTTTYNVVAGSESNISIANFNGNTGAWTGTISALGAWSFTYEVLCDGVICDTATESGVGVKVNDADAVDNNRGDETVGTISHNVSDNDTACDPGATTYELVAGSETNISVNSLNAGTGAWSGDITAAGAWSFDYNILCDGVVCDTATESGNGTVAANIIKCGKVVEPIIDITSPLAHEPHNDGDTSITWNIGSGITVTGQWGGGFVNAFDQPQNAIMNEYGDQFADHTGSLSISGIDNLDFNGCSACVILTYGLSSIRSQSSANVEISFDPQVPVDSTESGPGVGGGPILWTGVQDEGFVTHVSTIEADGVIANISRPDGGDSPVFGPRQNGVLAAQVQIPVEVTCDAAGNFISAVDANGNTYTESEVDF